MYEDGLNILSFCLLNSSSIIDMCGNIVPVGSKYNSLKPWFTLVSLPVSHEVHNIDGTVPCSAQDSLGLCVEHSSIWAVRSTSTRQSRLGGRLSSYML